MVDEVFLHHHVLHRCVALLDCAVASVEAGIASKPSGSTAGKSKVMPVGAEQVDSLVAFIATVQVPSFVVTMCADCTEAFGQRLVEDTVGWLEWEH